MFIQVVKQLMEKQGVKQKDLAIFLDVKPNTISDWMNEKTQPNILYAYRISDFFNVSFDFLFTGKEKTPDGLTSDENYLLYQYRALSDQGQDRVRQTLFECSIVYKKDLPVADMANKKIVG